MKHLSEIIPSDLDLLAGLALPVAQQPTRVLEESLEAFLDEINGEYRINARGRVLVGSIIRSSP